MIVTYDELTSKRLLVPVLSEAGVSRWHFCVEMCRL